LSVGPDRRGRRFVQRERARPSRQKAESLRSRRADKPAKRACRQVEAEGRNVLTSLRSRRAERPKGAT
jgi:hypothetical protein